MALVLEVAYDDVAGLRHDFESQLTLGGLFVDGVDASALPPLAELTLRLCAGDGEPLTAPVRLTVASGQSACVEISASARETLAAAVAARTAGVVARPCPRKARLGDLDAPITALDTPPIVNCATAQLNDESEGEPPANDDPTVADDAGAAAMINGANAQQNAADARGQIPLDRRIALMSVAEKVQLALHGNRDARQILMRERAGVVQSSLVRNPKMSIDEVQALARAPQLAPETAEVLAQHPSWSSSAQLAMALVRNPRTPLPTATTLLGRLLPADLRVVAKGVGVRTQVAAAARKRLFDSDR